jgi:hypothetical protein
MAQQVAAKAMSKISGVVDGATDSMLERNRFMKLFGLRTRTGNESKMGDVDGSKYVAVAASTMQFCFPAMCVCLCTGNV